MSIEPLEQARDDAAAAAQSRENDQPTLPQPALDAGFRIPDDFTDIEARKLVEAVELVGGDPRYIVWRIHRVSTDGKEALIGKVDIRQFDEDDYSESIGPGDYRRRLMVAGKRGYVFYRDWTVAARSTTPTRPATAPHAPRPMSGPVEQPGELQELREQRAELLAAMRDRAPANRSPDWATVIPTCVTAATGMLKLFFDNRPSMADLLAIVEKKSGMGEIAEAIKTMRELASDQPAASDDGSFLRDLLTAALPPVLAELRANKDTNAHAPSLEPAGSGEAQPDPAGDEDKAGAAAMLSALVSLLIDGAQAEDADASAYALVVHDRLEASKRKGGHAGKVATAILDSLATGQVGQVAAWLVGSAPALAPYAEWVGEVEAEMRDMIAPPDAEPTKGTDDAEALPVRVAATDAVSQAAGESGGGGGAGAEGSSDG